MISVQNHLQQLNGNRHRIVIFWLLLLLLQACGGNRPQRPERTQIPRDTSTVVVKPDTVAVVVDTLEKPDKIIHKEVYNIAIMLPFALDGRFMYGYDFENPKNTPYRSLLALEMYEGMLVALRDLEQMGMKLKVNVYDTKNDETVVQNLLNKPEMKTMDLIIGPLFSKSLAVVAPFAKENRIFVVSPLLPKVELQQPNPYYINATATVETHGEAIALFAKEKYPNSRVLIIKREDEGEKALSQVIQQKYKSLPPTKGELPMIEVVSLANLSSHLSLKDTNIVVVPTFNKFHIKTAAATLSGLAPSYPIITVGMPTWFELVQSFEEDKVYNQLANINYHYTSSFFIDKETEQAERFRKRVKDRFNVPATEYTYKGYDLMLYLGKMLANYGMSFAQYLDEYNATIFEGNYKFEPELIDENGRKKQSNIEYYENKSVPVIRFKDNKFIRVY